MMNAGVPLQEVLSLEPLRRARVVAGAKGLRKLVRYVNVMEVPDILAWVKPDELLLTTTYPLRDERAALDELVPNLAAKGLAGLAIKPARYLEAIPQPMLEAAERLDFPLLELPLDVSFNDVINSVLAVILNEQALRLERSAAIHERFTSIVLSGGGLREIVRALAELIGCPTAIVDVQGTVLALSSQSLLSTLGTRLADALPATAGGLRWGSLGTPEGERSIAWQPIQSGAEQHGAVVALVAEGALRDEELVALEHAATVAALRLAQARLVAEADRRFYAVCLEEMVSGHITDRDVLHERALAFGWDLSLPRAVLVAELEELGGRPAAQFIGALEERRTWRRLAEAAAETLGRHAIVWERGVGVAALVPVNSRRAGDLQESARRLQAVAAGWQPRALVAVGVGRVYADPLDLRRSHAEALRALRVGRRARGLGQVSFFEELGLDRLLMSCAEDELAAYYEASLGDLLRHDAAHGTQLVETLEAFLACDRNSAQAARQLFVHYNTLKHRLDRIEGIIGPFVGNPRRCLDLDLALRVRHLLAQ
ncbi:MAG: PucR family transcriptional regulator [Chloroflexota bacterium]